MFLMKTSLWWGACHLTSGNEICSETSHIPVSLSEDWLVVSLLLEQYIKVSLTTYLNGIHK